jgi:hypothetical protein
MIMHLLRVLPACELKQTKQQDYKNLRYEDRSALSSHITVSNEDDIKFHFFSLDKFNYES